MFIEVLSFCAMTLSQVNNICLWYSDVNSYYYNKEECVENIEITLNNEKLILEVELRMLQNYSYMGNIQYTGYCIEGKNLYKFFREKNLNTEKVPETL